MRSVVVLLSALCFFAAAMAAEPPTAIDLDLPAPPVFSAAPGYQADPPGTYYGDHSGLPASIATAGPGCPTAPDGSERSVTGSVTTGIGYASHGGSSRFNAVNVNVCKESFDDDGDPRAFNLNIDVQQVDGDIGGGYGYGRRGPRGR